MTMAEFGTRFSCLENLAPCTAIFVLLVLGPQFAHTSHGTGMVMYDLKAVGWQILLPAVVSGASSFRPAEGALRQSGVPPGGRPGPVLVCDIPPAPSFER